jgi:hypothetical protein
MQLMMLIKDTPECLQQIYIYIHHTRQMKNVCRRKNIARVSLNFLKGKFPSSGGGGGGDERMR